MYFGGTQLLAEYKKVSAFFGLLLEWNRSGMAKLIDIKAVDKKIEELIKSGVCRSNDQHIIGLLIVSNARVVCTEDQALHEDIKNQTIVPIPKRKIYQNITHMDLIAEIFHR